VARYWVNVVEVAGLSWKSVWARLPWLPAARTLYTPTMAAKSVWYMAVTEPSVAAVWGDPMNLVPLGRTISNNTVSPGLPPLNVKVKVSPAVPGG